QRGDRHRARRPCAFRKDALAQAARERNGPKKTLRPFGVGAQPLAAKAPQSARSHLEACAGSAPRRVPRAPDGARGWSAGRGARSGADAGRSPVGAGRRCFRQCERGALRAAKAGYVAAFRSPQLARAIGSGPARAIAVTMTQWTGPALQVQVVPWMIVSDEASMARLAGVIAAAPRQLFGGGTSISGAIDHALALFCSGPFSGGRPVSDIS